MNRTFALALLASTALMSAAAQAQQLPSGGQVAAGSATIGTPQSGVMTITQASDRAVINWRDFSIGAGERVDILQPDAGSALLNRVTGDTRSTIAGQINANGQVFLVNPNGILITPTGTVSAAGFVASTLDLDEKQFMDGKITATGRGGSIANYGTISIVKGGFAALIGGRVENAGLIVAPLGKVGLGAGTRATLDLEGDGFLQVALPASGGGIVMPGRIVADGGAVVLSAAQARDVARSTVNLSGVIETKGVKRRGGTVVLTGDAIQLTGAAIDVSGAAGGGSVTIGGGAQGKGDIAHALTLNVDAASSITADATGTGDGGDIILWSDQRTDFAGAISATGAGVGTGGDAEVSSAGLLGFTGTANLTGSRFGTLLLDPYNITISNGADTGGFTANADDSVINATTLVGALATANVTVATGAGGAQGGNISVATPLAWTSKGTLTLDAAGAISLGASIDAAVGGLTLNAGGAISAAGGMSVARFTLASGNWTQNNATLPAFAAGDFRITGGIFLRATGGAGSSVSPWALADIYGVQGIATMFSGHFTLANDIDAAGTAGWNDGAGFAPIGNFNSNGGFTGSLSGAGHVVSGLTINRPSQDYVALIGYLARGGRVSGIGMAGGAISGSNYVGGLTGFSFGTVSNAHATGAVSGDAYVGGLVGYSNNMLSDAYATGAVSGSGNYVGGLVGYSGGTLSNAYATGAVSGSGNYVGGLAGFNTGTVNNAYWDMGTTGQTTSGGGTGLTTAQARDAASYVGFDFGNVWYQAGGMRPILRSEAVRDASNTYLVSNLHQLQLMGADLAGDYRLTGDIDAAATNSTDASSGIFGAAGFSPVGNFDDRFTGSLDGAGHVVSGLTINRPLQDHVGLIGYLGTVGSVSRIGLASGAVSGNDFVGGLLGYSDGMLSNAYATGAVNGSERVGGLVGVNIGTVSNAYATGAVSGITNVGGLVGINVGMVSNAYASGAVSGNVSVGGLVGENYSAVNNAYWDMGTTGQTTSGGGTGLTTAQARDAASYVGFDFGNVWYQAGGMRPILRSEAVRDASNTYLVSNLHQLQLMGADLVGDYRLTRDIDATATDSTDASSGIFGAAGFSPVGNDSNGGFIGSLDGVGHVVSGLTINRPSQDHVGLIGYLGTVGSVSGIGMTRGSVSGNLYVGGLVGYNAGGTVSDAYATGTVSGIDYVGGLAGINIGTVSNAYATGAVSGTWNVGGLLGFHSLGTVSNAYATGAVSGRYFAGGLVGHTGGGTVSNAYATGAVSGITNVGGLVGYNDGGALSNAYATGAVSGRANVGGLVGTNSSTLSNAYATGAVGGDEFVGGLVGDNSGTVSDAYWDIGTTGQMTSAGGIGLTTAQLQSGGASGLGAAFSGGASGLYPYLTSFFPDGVQAISGFAYGADGAGAAIAQVGIHVNGGLLGATTISTGTNGYYYMMVPVGTFPAASNMLGQTVTLAGASSVSGLTYSDGLALDGNGNLSGLSVTSGLRTATTALQSWSALTAALPAPFDAVSYAAFTPALASTSWDVTATNVGGFTVDVPLALGGADLTLASARNLTLASGVSIAASSITLSAQGRFVNNAGANALSASDRWLVYLPRTAGNFFGELDSGNTARWGIAAGTAVSTAGNRYVFAEEAILTFTPAVTTKAYGEALTFGLTEGQHFTVTGYRQGVAGAYLGDTGASAWIGTPIFSSNGAAAGANVKPGGYDITLAGITGLGDYRVDTLTGTLTVTPATLTYAADAATRAYGAANPVLGGSVAGFVNGEDLAGATTGTLAFASMAGASANVGSYAANGSGLAANHGNYVFVQAAHNATALSVTPAQLTVTGNKVYDRTPGYVTGQLMVTGGVNGEAVSLTSGSGTVGSFDAGSHTGSLSGLAIAVAGGNGLASNYQLPTTGTLAITPRALVVTADAISRIYGDANPTMGGATGDDLVAGDTITSVTLASPATGASNVGRYDLTGSGATGNGLGNYTITYATRVGGFAVTPRPITVTADGLTRLYGDADPALTYTIGGRGLVNGDLLSGALVTDATDTRGVGIYGITQGTLAASANYTINPFVAGTFTILPKAPPPGTIAGTLLRYQFAGRTRPLPGSVKLRILRESAENGGWGAGQTFATCPGGQQEVLCTAN